VDFKKTYLSKSGRVKKRILSKMYIQSQFKK
jgi:hypothetical protein